MTNTEKFNISDEEFDKFLSLFKKRHENLENSIFANAIKLTAGQAKTFIDLAVDKVKNLNLYVFLSEYINPLFDSFLSEEVYQYYIEKLISIKQLFLKQIHTEAFQLPPLAYFEMDEEEYDNSFFEKEDFRFLDSLTENPEKISDITSAILRNKHSMKKLTGRMSAFMYNNALKEIAKCWENNSELFSRYEVPLPEIPTQKEDI